MTKETIKIIGFDGLHRCGKETQINLMKEELDRRNIHSIVLRGDGTRKGEGLDERDPLSIWWRKNRPFFLSGSLSREEILETSDQIYSRLTREINYYYRKVFPEDIATKGVKDGVMLLDRTFFSHLFVMRQLNRGISIKDALTTYHPRNKSLISPIIPYITFVFDVPLEVLLERCNSSVDSPEKRSFRIKNLYNHYQTFRELLDEMSLQKDYRVRIVEGNSGSLEIHKPLLDLLRNNGVL